MRYYRLLLVALVLLSVRVGSAAAASPDSFYHPYLTGQKKLDFAPDAAFYEAVRKHIQESYVDEVTDTQLLTGARDEAAALLAEAGIDPIGLQDVPLTAEFPITAAHRFAGKIDPRLLWLAMVRGEIASLGDPSSHLMLPEEYRGLVEYMTSFNFGGIGIYVELDADNRGALTVVEPIEDTPAARAGLQPGDVISAVDQDSTTGLSIDTDVQHIRGTPGTVVRLTIRRRPAGSDREQTLEVNITRAEIHAPYVTYKILEPGIGYIHPRVFGEATSNDVLEAIQILRTRGMRTLVFDLRNNGGGYLSSAAQVCSVFVQPGNQVVSFESRARETEALTTETMDTPALTLPLVVLVNQYSASATEVVAGCLQDLQRARLIGETTIGKGGVQDFLPLPDGARLVLTISQFWTPKHHPIRHTGITPDDRVPMNPRNVGRPDDIQLAEAVEYARSLP